MKTSPTISKIATALLEAQREMDSVSKSADNPFFHSKYADINSFLDVATPALNKHGVLLLQPPGSSVDGHFVEMTLIHAESGEFISNEPFKFILSKQDMQNLGACTTYARRFCLQSFLGMKAEDDDGETAVGRGTPRQQTKPVQSPIEPMKPANPMSPNHGDAAKVPSMSSASPATPSSAIVGKASPVSVQSIPTQTVTPTQSVAQQMTPPPAEAPKKTGFRKPSTMSKPSGNNSPFGG